MGPHTHKNLWRRFHFTDKETEIYRGNMPTQSLTFFFLNKFINLIIYFWLHWVFVAARKLSLVAMSRGCSLLRCAGFSLQWLLLLWSMGSWRAGFSSCGSRALERRLSSCGTRAQLLHGMQDPPGPGIKPVSPALAGGFLTTAPPGKPPESYFFTYLVRLGEYGGKKHFPPQGIFSLGLYQRLGRS